MIFSIIGLSSLFHKGMVSISLSLSFPLQIILPFISIPILHFLSLSLFLFPSPHNSPSPHITLSLSLSLPFLPYLYTPLHCFPSTFTPLCSPLSIQLPSTLIPSLPTVPFLPSLLLTYSFIKESQNYRIGLRLLLL